MKALDDFQFDVVDDQLRPLVSVGTREGYELKHCAEFIGRVEEVPMLAVGTYALKEKRLAEYVKAQEDLQATSSDQVLARSDERRPQSDGVDLDRKSVVWGKSVSVSVDLGGTSVMKQKKIDVRKNARSKV